MFWWISKDCKSSNACRKRIFFQNCNDLFCFTWFYRRFLTIHASRIDWNWSFNNSFKAFSILLSASIHFWLRHAPMLVLNRSEVKIFVSDSLNHDLIRITTGDPNWIYMSMDISRACPKKITSALAKGLKLRSTTCVKRSNTLPSHSSHLSIKLPSTNKACLRDLPSQIHYIRRPPNANA